MSEHPNILFVAWQDEKYRFYTVARLMRCPHPDQPQFEFAYVKGAIRAAEEAGFRPFLAFPSMENVYRSDQLFPFFTNRLLPGNRPDYPEYVRHLGLDPADADPLAILARSGGGRATDSIEMYPCPCHDPSPYTTWFCAHGVHRLGTAARNRILILRTEEPLLPTPEPENPVDPSAIALYTEDRIKVGYLPRYLLPDSWQLLQGCGGYSFNISVSQVNRSAPMLQWLVCRLESCWPSDFIPFSADTFKPISDQASPIEIRPPWVSQAAAS